MQPIHDFVRHLRFTEGLSPSDIIGWILAGIAGYIAYRLIDHMQTSIERHSMLSSIEDGITELFNSLIAISVPDGEKLPDAYNGEHQVMVRSVLHDNTSWQCIYNEKKELEYKIINHQRYIHIRNTEGYNEWISTQALHEICLKMRRIEKMFKGGVVKRIDLSDMFREIIPLGISGRLEFIKNYYGDYDAECIAYLVMQTVVSCEKYHNHDIVKTFVKYYKENKSIQSLFISNRRVRKIRDIIAVQRFRSILDSAG